MNICPICIKNKIEKFKHSPKFKLCAEHSKQLYQEMQEIIMKMNEESNQEKNNE